jgi:hypothetical protein
MMPDICHRQREVFREGAGPIHADPTRVRAQVSSSRETVAASPTDYVSFTTHDLTWEEVVHIASYFNNLAYELVSHDHWNRDGFLRPGIPFVNVKISSADTRAPYLDEDIIDSALWSGNVLQSKAGGGVGFYEGFHVAGIVAHAIRYTRDDPV